LLRRLRLRQIVVAPALEKLSKYYQFHLHRGKVPFVAMRHQEVGELSVAWRRRRMLQPLLRRLRLRHMVVPPALEKLTKHYPLHLHRGKSITWRRRRML
jgi:hypothetical protein